MNEVVVTEVAVRPGRPRRFSPDAELQLILDAAMTVMRRAASADANVTEILEEAGLSTRAFYRHFASKDDLLRKMARREAERAAARLATRVAAVGSTLGKLEAWVDEMLSFGYDRRKAVRVALLSSEAAQRAADDSERRRVREAMSAPLVTVLSFGRGDGTFPSALPDSHARSIQALVGGLLQASVAGTPVWTTQAEAVAEVLRFCLPALGATDHPSD